MVERGGSDDHERQYEARSKQGQERWSRCLAQEHQKHDRGRQCTATDETDEIGLHDPAALVPALPGREYAPQFGERRLEVELLVDAEREEQQGDHGPDGRFRPRVRFGIAQIPHDAPRGVGREQIEKDRDPPDRRRVANAR